MARKQSAKSDNPVRAKADKTARVTRKRNPPSTEVERAGAAPIKPGRAFLYDPDCPVLSPLPDVVKRLPWRPSGCTEQVIQAVKDVHPAILSVRYFAKLIGVDYRTIANWCSWGEKELERIGLGESADPLKANYLEFYQQMHRARAITVLHVQSRALIGADGWQGGMRVLEQMDGARFGRRQAIEIVPPRRPEPTSVQGTTITTGSDTHEPSSMPPAALQALINRMKATP